MVDSSPRSRPEPEPNSYARLRRELEQTEDSLVKILQAAPRATTKYPSVGRAGRAVLDALTRALRDHADAESRWLQWRREHGEGRR